MMKYAFAVIALLIGAPAAAVEDEYQVRQAAEAFNAAWEQAVEARDWSSVGRQYTDDAVMLPPTDETLYGPLAAQSYLQSLVETKGLRDVHLQIVDVSTEGDLATVACVWYAKPAEPGRYSSVGGNWLRVLERQADGSWRSRFEIWN